MFSVSPFISLLSRPSADEVIDMNNSEPSKYSGITLMLTDKGLIALAADALVAAEKSRNNERRKALCEQAMIYLRRIVQESETCTPLGKCA